MVENRLSTPADFLKRKEEEDGRPFWRKIKKGISERKLTEQCRNREELRKCLEIEL